MGVTTTAQKFCLAETEESKHDADDYNQTDNINNGVQNVPLILK